MKLKKTLAGLKIRNDKSKGTNLWHWFHDLYSLSGKLDRGVIIIRVK